MKNGKVIAYNTDAPGFLKAIESFGKVKMYFYLELVELQKLYLWLYKKKGISVTVLNRSEGKLDFFQKQWYQMLNLG